MLALVFGIGMNACTDTANEVTPKTLDEYKVSLKTFVDSEISKVNACVLGFNTGDFKSTTTNIPNFEPYKVNYLKDLNDALVVVNKADVTIADLVKSRSNLTANGKLFNTSLWTADRRALNDLIVELTTLNSSTTAGTASGQAPQAAKDALTAAITAAKAIRDSALPVQMAIDAAVVTLSTAKTTFQAAIIK